MLQVTISTEGKAPIVSKKLGEDIEKIINR